MRRFTLSFALLSFLLLLAASPGQSAEIKKSVPFQIGQWIELGLEDGPATLHRMRITEESGGFQKSKFFRPGNDEYLQTIQIQIEYSNHATRDWEADIAIEWVDAKGVAIDGYNDSEDLDDDERRDLATVTLSTLKYGLEKAKKLEIAIEIYPD